MNILKAGFEILTPISEGGIEELKHIEKIARVCYKSEEKITEDGESAKKFVKMLLNRGHEAMIEHSSLSVKFIVDRGCCYDKETRVLTKQGWKYFYELTENDSLLTLDDDNNTCYLKPTKIIKEYYAGELDYWHSTQIDLAVTPNHNMWLYDYHKRSADTRIWKFIESQDANNRRYMFNKSANPTNNEGYSIYTVEGCDINRGTHVQHYDSLDFNADLFFELLGLWVTDGCVSFGKNGSGNRLCITQVKPKIRDRIQFLLDELNIEYTANDKEFRLKCPQLFAWIVRNFINGTDARKTYYLKLPRWMFETMSRDNFFSFLKGIIEGNGSRHTKGPGFQIYTGSKNFAEDLVEMSLFMGLCANIRTDKPRTRLFPNGNEILCKEQYVVSIVITGEHLFSINNSVLNKTGKTKYKYSDYVYCVELPKYHRLYVMRNGKSCWCGNSHELVRHRIASFAQESTRYVNYSLDKFGNEINVIDATYGALLDNKMKNMSKSELYAVIEEWTHAMEDAEKHYMKMIELGATPQIARSVLPNSTKTEITVTANYREWRAFFGLRTASTAHPQCREVTIPLLNELKTLIPIIFDDILVDEDK